MLNYTIKAPSYSSVMILSLPLSPFYTFYVLVHLEKQQISFIWGDSESPSSFHNTGVYALDIHLKIGGNLSIMAPQWKT